MNLNRLNKLIFGIILTEEKGIDKCFGIFL